MKKKSRILLTLLLAAVFAVCTGLLLQQQRDNKGAGQSYSDALAIARQAQTVPETREPTTAPTEAPQPRKIWIPAPVEDDPVVEELETLDLETLREVNPEVIGWIRIPDTKIDYPILQGEDNDYYLNHTWEGKTNSVGSIFMEYRNSADFTDYNTIVYGHNMNDGSMFANLKRYNTNWYWERHPYVYILNDDGVFRYEVFSGYETSTEGTAYGLSFNQAQTRATFSETALKKSTAYFEIRPAMTDRILTLSTCSGAGYSNRWVVHARLKMIPADSVG